jgi:hypothetical protein
MWRLKLPNVHVHVDGGPRLGLVRSLYETAHAVGPVVLLSILFQVVFAALLAFMALYLVDARGMPPAQAAVTGVPQIIGVLGCPSATFLDRLGAAG